MTVRKTSFFTLVLAILGASQGHARAGITNGDFETGNLSGWSTEGFTGGFQPRDTTPHIFQSFQSGLALGKAATSTNGALTSQVTGFTGNSGGAPISPTQGNYLGFVSNETSAGGNTLTGSAIFQNFTVDAGATSLNFDIRFLSNEIINSHWDFGGLALTQGSTVLAQFTLDHDTVSAANAHATATAAGGFFDSTPWLSESFSLAGLSGQTLTLTAFSTNVADQLVESRLLLDNVRLVGSASVPEPTSLAMLGMGAAIASLHFARRRA